MKPGMRVTAASKTLKLLWMSNIEHGKKTLLMQHHSRAARLSAKKKKKNCFFLFCTWLSEFYWREQVDNSWCPTVLYQLKVKSKHHFPLFAPGYSPHLLSEKPAALMQHFNIFSVWCSTSCSCSSLQFLLHCLFVAVPLTADHLFTLHSFAFCLSGFLAEYT